MSLVRDFGRYMRLCLVRAARCMQESQKIQSQQCKSEKHESWTLEYGLCANKLLFDYRFPVFTNIQIIAKSHAGSVYNKKSLCTHW